MFIDKSSLHFAEYEAIVKLYRTETEKKDSSEFTAESLFNRVREIKAARHKAALAVATLAFNHFNDLIDIDRTDPIVFKSFFNTFKEMGRLKASQSALAFDAIGHVWIKLVDEHLLKDL